MPCSRSAFSHERASGSLRFIAAIQSEDGAEFLRDADVEVVSLRGRNARVLARVAGDPVVAELLDLVGFLRGLGIAVSRTSCPRRSRSCSRRSPGRPCRDSAGAASIVILISVGWPFLPAAPVFMTHSMRKPAGETYIRAVPSSGAFLGRRVVILKSASPSNCAEAAAADSRRRGEDDDRVFMEVSSFGSGLPGEQVREQTIGAGHPGGKLAEEREARVDVAALSERAARSAPFCSGPPGSAIARSGVYSGAQRAREVQAALLDPAVPVLRPDPVRAS